MVGSSRSPDLNHAVSFCEVEWYHIVPRFKIRSKASDVRGRKCSWSRYREGTGMHSVTIQNGTTTVSKQFHGGCF